MNKPSSWDFPLLQQHSPIFLWEILEYRAPMVGRSEILRLKIQFQ